EPAGPEGDPPRPPARRHGRRPRLHRLRDGGVRQVTPGPTDAAGRPLEGRDPKVPPARGTRSTGWDEAAGAPEGEWDAEHSKTAAGAVVAEPPAARPAAPPKGAPGAAPGAPPRTPAPPQTPTARGGFVPATPPAPAA